PDALTHASRVQVERLTDPLEGEDPRPIGALDPLAGLAFGPPPAPGAGDLRHAKGLDGIIEDGGHESVLAPLFAPARSGKELLRKHDVGLEKRTQLLVVFHRRFPLPTVAFASVSRFHATRGNPGCPR